MDSSRYIPKLLLSACALALLGTQAHAENLIEQGMKDSVKKECHFTFQGDIVQGMGKLLEREHNYCADPKHQKKGNCAYTPAQKCADWKAISQENTQK